MKHEDIARMEWEMEVLGRNFLTIEESHGKNTLTLVLALAYLRKLPDRASVVKYLSQRYPEILSELQKLAWAPYLNRQRKTELGFLGCGTRAVLKGTKRG